MWWLRKRRNALPPARAEGQRLCDGDTVPIDGYPTWTELIRREYIEISPGEYLWTGEADR